MTKVVPIKDGMSEDLAATKVQAMVRGKNSRTEHPYTPGKVEQRMMSSKNLGSLGGGKQKSWGLIRAKTDIKFDNWDMALQVIPAGWRGEVAREVKRRVESAIPDPYGAYAKIYLAIMGYFTLYFWLGPTLAGIPQEPTLARWTAVILIWCCSTLGGKAMGKIGMPGLLGNLLSGVLLKNIIPYPGGGYDFDNPDCGAIPYGASASASGSGNSSGYGRRLAGGGGIDYSVPNWCLNKSLNGLPDDWASDIITFGLTIIFMRGGLELDIELVKKAGAAALRLTVMPGVSEAIMVAVFSIVIFSMDFLLGLSLGFILAAVSPAVVVGAMFELKKKGFGVKQNIPTLVVAAASMDDVVAISGFSIAVAFAIPNKSSTTLTVVINAIHGPLTVIVGGMLGLIGGNVAAMTKVWDKPWKRVVVVAIQGFFLAFAAKTLENKWYVDGAHPIGASTGILGALSMAGTSAYLWENGRGYLSIGKQKHYAHDTEATLASLWALVAQPLLFGVVGSFLDFRRMPAVTIGKAIAIVLLGVSCRTMVAFIAMFKAGLKKKEQLFVALAWLPKATVQAAFCAYPYDKIYAKPSSDWNSPEEEADYKQWGLDILVTGGLAILMTAPIGLIIIQKLGPKWLEQDSSQSFEKSIDDMVAKEIEERKKAQPKKIS